MGLTAKSSTRPARSPTRRCRSVRIRQARVPTFGRLALSPALLRGLPTRAAGEGRPAGGAGIVLCSRATVGCGRLLG